MTSSCKDCKRSTSVCPSFIKLSNVAFINCRCFYPLSAASSRGTVPKTRGKQNEPIKTAAKTTHQSPHKPADKPLHKSVDQAAVKKTMITHHSSLKSSIQKPKEHVTSFFSSEPGLDESELEVVGHVKRKRKRKRSNLKQKRHTSGL